MRRYFCCRNPDHRDHAGVNPEPPVPQALRGKSTQSAPTPYTHEAIKVAGSRRGDGLWLISQGAEIAKRGARLEEMGYL